jgi:hypothetical protein
VGRSLVRRGALGATLAALAFVVPAALRAAEIDPCSLIPNARVVAMTGGTGKMSRRIMTGRYAQKTCHYDGPLRRALVVAVHLDAHPFATVKSMPMMKPLAGVGAEAIYQAGPPSVIAFLKHGHYVSMSWNADPGKPSPQFLAAAKAAAAKL